MSRVIGDVALDTNAAIAYMGDEPAAVAWIEAASALFLPVVCIGELEYGALHSGNPQKNLQKLQTLFQQCAVLPVTRQSAHEYAEIRQALSLQGKPIPEADLWIAAVCLETKLPLLTDDAHFDAVPNLKRYNWTAPVPRRKRKRK